MPVSDTCPTTLWQTPEEAVSGKAALVAALDACTTRYRGMHFGFSDPDLLAALKRMVARGVDMLVLIDWRQFTGPSEFKGLHDFLAAVTPGRVRATNSPVHSQIEHDKVSVVDGKVVIDGSLNWTLPAWDEVNEFRITESAALAAAYEAKFDALWQYAGAHEAQYATKVAADAA